MAEPDVTDMLATIGALEQRLLELRKSIFRGIQDAELPAGKADLVTCEVGTRLVALALDRVRGVAPRCSLTPLPNSPPWVAGLLDYQGDVMPVIDLQARLVGEPVGRSTSGALILCHDGIRRAALLAQAIGQVHMGAELGASDDLHEVPHGPYVATVARLAGRTVIVLSVARLLAAVAAPEADG